MLLLGIVIPGGGVVLLSLPSVDKNDDSAFALVPGYLAGAVLSLLVFQGLAIALHVIALPVLVLTRAARGLPRASTGSPCKM